MKKHAVRHSKARMIRAAANPTPFRFEAETVEWTKAADDGGDATKPKRFSMTAYTGGAMQVGYGSPVVIELSGMKADAPLPILLNHDRDQIVGHADEVTIGSALKLSGLLSGASAQSEQVKNSAGMGFPWKASVGARPDKMEFVGEDVTTKVNGKTFKGPLYVARKSTLGEVSFVPMAADSKTTVKVAATGAAHFQKEKNMDYDQWVNALFGGEVPELQQVQTAALKAKFDAEVAAKQKSASSEPGEKIEAKADPPQFDLRGVALAHEKHVATVEAHVATYADKIEAAPLAKIRADGSAKASELKLKALNEEWPVPRLEVELIRAQKDVEVALIRGERPKAPAIHSSNRDIGNEVIEAALCGSAGLRGLEKTYKPEVLEAADRYRRREGGSLQSLILAAAEANGYSGARRIHRGNFDEVMRAALIQASSPSTHTLTTMLSSVGNKFLLEGFSSVEEVYREISDIRPVNDFKAITSYRMLDDMVFEEIGPSGEIKHGTADQESFTNQAKTYAKMFALTRTDIINDDLGAFSTIRTRIGRGSGIKLNQVFWASFLDDATLFNATALASGGHLNLLTAVLGETGIAAANVLLKSKTDGHGNPIDIGGAHLLLTGATLSPTAKKWYVSQEIRDTTASTKTPTTNIYYNTFRPVESRYITSTTSWYLLPVSGGDMAPMEICFLNGVQSPTIESADADFNTLGIQFRGYFDFGVAKKEWRASVKSTGAG